MSALDLVVEPGKQEITYTRTFDAPAAAVFKAHTDPEAIARWWGPRHLTTTIDRMDARPGGEWRFVHRDPEGTEYAFRGVYHSVESPRRIVQTFEFEGMPGHVQMETLTLEEHDGRTTLTAQSVFQSVADRDGMVQSGMEGGLAESMDRLEELLGTAVLTA